MNKTAKIIGLILGVFALLIAIFAGTFFVTYNYVLNNLPKQTFESPAPERFTIAALEKSKGAFEDQLAFHSEQALADGRKPFVYFSATWCPPCQVIKKTIDDPLMVDAFSGTYIIQVDIDDWEDEISESDFWVWSIPAFDEVDEFGRPTGYAIDGGEWEEDIPENIAPVLKEYFNSGQNRLEASR